MNHFPVISLGENNVIYQVAPAFLELDRAEMAAPQTVDPPYAESDWTKMTALHVIGSVYLHLHHVFL